MPKLVVALVPPEPYFSEIEKWQKEFQQKYGGKEVDLYPPHITLKGIGKVERNVEGIIKRAERVARATAPFEVCVDGHRFHGTNERIIGVYLNVLKGEKLYGLHSALVRELKEFEDKPRVWKEMENWNPHFAICYPDIGQEAYERAKVDPLPQGWPPKFSFLAQSFQLLYMSKDTKKHEVLEEFELGRVS